MAKKILVQSTVNGEQVEFHCEARQSLLEALRDTLLLTGTKEGCNDGNCGACNVIMDGVLVDSCCVLAVEAEGKSILTIEGITPKGGGLHPIQQVYLEDTGLQCGICTPGFIVATKALLDKYPNPTENQIRYWLAGNLCRCTGYDKIVLSVQHASKLMEAKK